MASERKPYVDDGTLGINLPPEQQTYDPFPVSHVCDLCGCRAIPAKYGDGWMHAEAADAAFCHFVFRGGRDGI